MTFIAVTTHIKTPSGLLYSPQLFDAATGAYPISPLPARPHYYPVDGTGKIPYFDHAEVDAGTSITATLSTTGPTVAETWDPNQTDWVIHDTTSTTVKTWTFRALTEAERSSLTMRTTFSAIRERARYTVPGGYDSNNTYYNNRPAAAVAELVLEYLNASGVWTDCTPSPSSTDPTSGTATWTSVLVAIPAASMNSTPSFRVRMVDLDREERAWATPAPPSDTVSASVTATHQVISAPAIS